MQNIALVLSAFVLITACTKSVEEPVEANLEADVRTEIPYGLDSKQKLDIHLPANRSRSQTKVFVLIHGGGWTGGDKNDLIGQVAELKKRFPDYAIANLNYRVYNNNQFKFPSQENDINAALQFLSANARNYHISSQYILVGTSAGAHLALLQAYKHTASARPLAVISYFGPTDLAYLYAHAPNPGIPYLLNSLTGTTPSQNADAYKQSSPVHFVSGSATPTLIFHGGKDDLIPPSQSVLLRDRLQGVNAPHKLVMYPNEGHSLTGTNLLNSFEEIRSFLQQHTD
jgi:acetyl esterase/lipase